MVKGERVKGRNGREREERGKKWQGNEGEGMEGEREEEREGITKGITKGTGMLKAKLGLTEIILSTCRGDVKKVAFLGVTYHIVGEPSLPEAIVVQLPLFVVP